MSERDSIRRCEVRLEELLGRRHCILTGRGASALALVYRLLPADRNGVILPATLCLSPWCVAVLTGCPVYFADVRSADGTIDPASVISILRRQPDVGMVVAANIFGNPLQIEELERICHDHNVYLVEDAAQALGGVYPTGRFFGGCGDCSIVSFGYAKILDAGGGGAVLTDDNGLAKRLREEARRLPAELPKKAPQIAKTYAALYHAIWKSVVAVPDAIKLYRDFPKLFQVLYMHAATARIAEAILGVLPGLDAEVKRRRQLATEYRLHFESCSQVEIISNQSGVPWRFTMLVPATKRDKILAAVRARGIDISSWYPPVACHCSLPVGERMIPVAEDLAARVINLWVTEDYADRWRETTRVVRDELDNGLHGVSTQRWSQKIGQRVKVERRTH